MSITDGFRKIRLIAVDCDGVLIDDSYLAVIERFVTRHGGHYDEQAERSIVGLQDIAVAERVGRLCGLDQPSADTLATMWRERSQYLAEHPIGVGDGVEDFLTSLGKLGVRVVCYGGRAQEHTFDPYLGHLVDLFDPEHPYVSINEHRPGVAWIIHDVIGCDPGEAIFIDDVSRVADAAREFGSGFIGFPSSAAHRRQRRFMAEAGVRHIVSSLGEITPGLLGRIDDELVSSSHWDPVASIHSWLG